MLKSILRRAPEDLPDQAAPLEQAEQRAEPPAAAPAAAAIPQNQDKRMQNTVHFVLQGKGGVGKTLVSTILAQWVKTKAPDALRCYDTDQENTTFSRYKALDVQHIAVMTAARTIEPKRFDALMMDILESDGNCVIDNGANTFSPLMAYLIDNACFDLLRESGRRVFIHSIVGGGDILHDTASGFATTAQKTNAPIILWENEHFGLLQTPSGRQFTESQTYTEHADKVRGHVKLSERSSETFGADLKKMNTARMTLDEVLQSDKFNVMEKQRVKLVFRDIFEQLDRIAW